MGILILIAAASIELCFTDVTVRPGSTKMVVLGILDVFFTAAFALEV